MKIHIQKYDVRTYITLGVLITCFVLQCFNGIVQAKEESDILPVSVDQPVSEVDKQGEKQEKLQLLTEKPEGEEKQQDNQQNNQKEIGSGQETGKEVPLLTTPLDHLKKEEEVDHKVLPIPSPIIGEWKTVVRREYPLVAHASQQMYEVTFTYQVRTDAQAECEYLFTITNERDKRQLTEHSWSGKPGEQGTRTITFQVPETGTYSLEWHAKESDSLLIDDSKLKLVEHSSEQWELELERAIEQLVQKMNLSQSKRKKRSLSPDPTLIRETFEGDPKTSIMLAKNGLTSQAEQVINGRYSAYMTVPPTEDGDICLNSDPGQRLFAKNSMYWISFTFKGLDVPIGKDSVELFFCGVTSDMKRGTPLQTWKVKRGEIKTKTVLMKTGELENAVLVWGIKQGGAVAVDDIQIKRVRGEDQETGTPVTTTYTYGVTNELQQVQSTSGNHYQLLYDENGNQIGRSRVPVQKKKDKGANNGWRN